MAFETTEKIPPIAGKYGARDSYKNGLQILILTAKTK